MKKRKKADRRQHIAVICADPGIGLTDIQAEERKQGGWAAGVPKAAGKSELEITFLHIFTFFNLIFAVLATLLVISGSTIKNMTFLIVAVCNALIGIIQEIRAKRAVDKLTLVAARPVKVIREGEKREIHAALLVRDDIALFAPGDQICADGILRCGALQVNESLITGESDAVTKGPGDEVKSGSFVITGHGRVQVTAVGEDSFAAKLAMEAKANPKASKSEMMRSLDKLIQVVGLLLIPVGAALLYQQISVLKLGFRENSEGTVAALVGMIPEGLYLLTSIAMAASAVKLSRDRVLVQDMNCIESLARVDVLCVDKTGTITEPFMEVQEVILLDNAWEHHIESVLSALYRGEEPDNDTARAMAARFSKETDWVCRKRIPFTSAAKWSGGVFADHGAYIAGAPEFILGNRIVELREQVDGFANQGYRVLLTAGYDGEPVPGKLEEKKITPLALILLSSPVREKAKETFDYFEAQGVSVRVISGDNAQTASQVALRAGIQGAEKYIDASTLYSAEEIAEATRNYQVFGRVTPNQKKKLIQSLQAQGHTVAMTGDGVNDLLAMKQADCSVAMASGAQAASQVASMVLLDSDFAGMPSIVAEGRRVINNIQRAATLFLVKNIFSLLLSLISLATFWPYPFEPVHLTLISSLTIGIPSFFLAMEPNYSRFSGRFIQGVLRRALPGGLTNVLMVLTAQILLSVLGIPSAQTATVCAAIMGMVGLLVLHQVCRPFGWFRRMVWSTMAVAMVLCFTLLGPLFELRTGTTKRYILMTCLLAVTPLVFFAIQRLFDWGDRLYLRLKK